MQPYKLYVRNMVCPRCIQVVTSELQKLQLPVSSVTLGEATLHIEPTNENLNQIREVLAANGFELLEDRKAELVEKVKIAVIELIRSGKMEELSVNLS